MNTDISFLVVSPGERHCWLVQQLERHGALVLQVAHRHRARQILQTWGPEIVLTDELLPDGNWTEVLQDVRESNVGAEVLVCTGPEFDTRLLFDALDLGADLVLEPHEPDQVQWLLGLAATRNRLRWSSPNVGAAAS